MSEAGSRGKFDIRGLFLFLRKAALARARAPFGLHSIFRKMSASGKDRSPKVGKCDGGGGGDRDRNLAGFQSTISGFRRNDRGVRREGRWTEREGGQKKRNCSAEEAGELLLT